MSHLVQDRPAQALAERDTELLTPATQIVGDTDAYLGNAASDIGRRIGEDQLELFVVCQPAEAMLQQFAQLTPDFIALHDVGTAVSARLLAAVAAASSRKLQKLVIRRQGYGVALATLQFVELPLAAGRMLRVYTTQIDADMQTRRQLAQVLLAHSRLAALIVGELPAHALDSNLQPLREAIAAGPWPNRQMLMVPLGSGAALPAQAAALAGHSGVMVRTTPQVARPAEAWSYISGAWNRLHSADAAPAARRTSPPLPMSAPLPAPVRTASAMQGFAPPPLAASYAATQPLELTPMPTVAAAPAAARPAGNGNGNGNGNGAWSEYVRRCATIRGLVECCVFDLDTQRSLAHSGAQRTADRLAAKGTMLHAMIGDSAQVLGLAEDEAEADITLP